MFANSVSKILCIFNLLPILFIFLVFLDHKSYNKWRIENRLKRKPKKKREVKLRKDNYPFKEGDSIDWTKSDF